MATTNALLIQSYTNIQTGVQGSWNSLTIANNYIEGIQTGVLNDGTNGVVQMNTLISGLPSPWARAKLFRQAMHSLANPNPTIGTNGLQQYYQSLFDEWKGLIAIMALYPDRIKISDPVELDPKKELYNMSGAFGRMLFSEQDVWSDQSALRNNQLVSPYIQLIYYRDKLVGATSPYTGVFTAIDYSSMNANQVGVTWYRNGKFVDPTPFLSPMEMQKVYLFVHNVNNNLSAFESNINSARNGKPSIDISGFIQLSQSWGSALTEGKQLRNLGSVAQYPNLQYPFSELFGCNVPVYLKTDGSFSYSDSDGSQLLGSTQGLLSTESYVVGWREQAEASPSLKDAPVYMLQVKELSDGSLSFFSIPLSEKGLDLFRNSMLTMLGYRTSATPGPSLTGCITETGDLAVTMRLVIDGEEETLGTREYKIKWINIPQKVILWPNFFCDDWNRYYLYSEFTAASPQHFVPIFRNRNGFIRTPQGDFFTPDYNPQDGTVAPVKIKHLVSMPTNIGEDVHKYDILESDIPIAGLIAYVKQGGKDVRAGILAIRPDVIPDKNNITTTDIATVGFDFGSNNTCVYYKGGQHDPEPIQFNNFRAMLVGRMNLNPNRVADIDELLFFSNYASQDGQFKSWLHEHDSRCVSASQSGVEIVGGVPVNRPNVQVEAMDEYSITTQAGILHYNMKWLDTDDGLQKKRAFLKSLWLQACAFMYSKRIAPGQINWSCPGSMMQSDIIELDKIFKSLCQITPMRNAQVEANGPTTEAEAVCSYSLALSDLGLIGSNMFLGIDVGGSTSDILLLAKDPSNGGAESLYRESSVRLAAGVFFNAIIKSQRFRNALVTFHDGHETGVNVMNIQELQNSAGAKDKAPYYLNCIFDQLKPAEYSTFYESLDANAKFVFTIPAYVTGVLLFYSGMLIGKTMKDHKLQGSLKNVDILPYGKGGRLFYWLKSSTGEKVAEQYYADCLNKGLGCIIPDVTLIVTFRDNLEENNKTEVARGLCDPRTLAILPGASGHDICGETGVKFRTESGELRTISVDEDLNGSYFAKNMNNFDFERGDNFSEFLSLFVQFVSQKTRLYPTADKELRQAIDDVPTKIATFIRNDKEYRKACNNKLETEDFPYHQPIFIAEAAGFLDTLIEKLFSK